jgi:hypothetical protein
VQTCQPMTLMLNALGRFTGCASPCGTGKIGVSGPPHR